MVALTIDQLKQELAVRDTLAEAGWSYAEVVRFLGTLSQDGCTANLVDVTAVERALERAEGDVLTCEHVSPDRTGTFRTDRQSDNIHASSNGTRRLRLPS